MSPYGVIFDKKPAPKVPVRLFPFLCSNNPKPAALPPSWMHGYENLHHNNNTCCIWLTTAPAGRGNKMCISLCLWELPQYTEDSLPSSNLLVVIYLPPSFCNLWVVWENNFRLCLRRLPAEAEISLRSIFVLSGVLLGGSVVFCAPQEGENKSEYVLLHSTNEICVNKPLSAARLYLWTFSTQTLTVLVEIAGGRNDLKHHRLPFSCSFVSWSIDNSSVI